MEKLDERSWLRVDIMVCLLHGWIGVFWFGFLGSRRGSWKVGVEVCAESVEFGHAWMDEGCEVGVGVGVGEVAVSCLWYGFCR